MAEEQADEVKRVFLVLPECFYQPRQVQQHNSLFALPWPVYCAAAIVFNCYPVIRSADRERGEIACWSSSHTEHRLQLRQFYLSSHNNKIRIHIRRTFYFSFSMNNEF